MNIPLMMEVNTKDSGENFKSGVMVKWRGQMDLSTRDTGRITAKMVWVYLCILMVTTIEENGLT